MGLKKISREQALIVTLIIAASNANATRSILLKA
jgi:hypothetical protein